jgi:hypothetical protein
MLGDVGWAEHACIRNKALCAIYFWSATILIVLYCIDHEKKINR